jgi:hypothetical protein
MENAEFVKRMQDDVDGWAKHLEDIVHNKIDCEDRYGITDEEEIKLFKESVWERFRYFVNDALDINYLISASGKYMSSKIIIGLGGPTTWIDTDSKQIIQCWGGERVQTPAPWDACEQIDEIVGEMYVLTVRTFILQRS